MHFERMRIRRGRRRIGLGSLLACLVLAGAGSPAGAGSLTVVSIPIGGGSDLFERGFYVESYAADNIDTVELRYTANTAGEYSIGLTVRDGSYDGPLVATQTLNREFTTTAAETVVFDLGAAPTTPGSTLTFVQEQLGQPGDSALLLYDTGPNDLGDDTGTPTGVVQTNGTTPPLDSFRRNGVGVVITAVPEPAASALLVLGLALLGRRRS